MPRDEEAVRAALEAQADANEEANQLCGLASLSLQGNADQKRLRLLVSWASFLALLVTPGIRPYARCQGEVECGAVKSRKVYEAKLE